MKIKSVFKEILFTFFIYSNIHSASAEMLPPKTAAIPLEDIKDFAIYPTTVQNLIIEAQELTKLNLTYLYGSHDPKNKGMDCSGTIYYLLNKNVLNLPRSADDMFKWVNRKGKFHAVLDYNFSSSEFSALKPGDLLFWSGTYQSKNYVTHVMLYIGKNHNNEFLMFGASNGRTYKGKKMWGVSVFDFKLPINTKTKFVGYSCIPDLTCN